LFKIKVIREEIKRNKSANPGARTDNSKFKMGNCEEGEKFKTKYPSAIKLRTKTISSQNGRLFLCIIQVYQISTNFTP
jgi:hypothetical protein